MRQPTGIFNQRSKKHNRTPAYDIVLSETIKLINKEFDAAGKVNEDSSLRDDLDLDSVEVMEFIEIFEDKFEVEIPIESLPELNTVGDLVRLICPLIQEKQN